MSIVDLFGGQQPIGNEDRSVQAVVCGEFYSAEEIRDELAQKGHIFRTRSDSEILVHLYENYGTACLDHLRGEFAFVLWDERIQQLFAARDRFGIRPLCYFRDHERLMLASEAKALFAFGLPARWDREAFLYNCLQGSCEPDRTLFADIKQVPPAHFLLASGGDMRIAPYWNLNYPKDRSVEQDSQKYVRAVQTNLLESVRLRLQADVPIAAYLSGGIDSSSVVAAAMSMRTEPLDVFTIALEGHDTDEESNAREVAKITGAHLHVVHTSPETLAAHFEDAVAQCELLLLNPHAVAKYLLSREVRKAGFKAVLTGEGADELLAGYGHFRKDREQQCLSDGSAFEDVLANRMGFVPGWMRKRMRFGSELLSLFNEADLVQSLAYNPAERLLAVVDVPGQLNGRSRPEQAMYLWCKTMLPNYELAALGDRTEMAHGIEGRVPFLDHVLADVIFNVPIDMKLRYERGEWINKHVLREAARIWLPDHVCARPKASFFTPPYLLQPGSALHKLAQDTLTTDTLNRVPFLNPQKVQNYLNRAPRAEPNQREAVGTILAMLVSACMLARRYALS